VSLWAGRFSFRDGVVWESSIFVVRTNKSYAFHHSSVCISNLFFFFEFFRDHLSVSEAKLKHNGK
jgi:hypothetical protein